MAVSFCFGILVDFTSQKSNLVLSVYFVHETCGGTQLAFVPLFPFDISSSNAMERGSQDQVEHVMLENPVPPFFVFTISFVHLVDQCYFIILIYVSPLTAQKRLT